MQSSHVNYIPSSPGVNPKFVCASSQSQKILVVSLLVAACLISMLGVRPSTGALNLHMFSLGIYDYCAFHGWLLICARRLLADHGEHATLSEETISDNRAQLGLWILLRPTKILVI